MRWRRRWGCGPHAQRRGKELRRLRKIEIVSRLGTRSYMAVCKRCLSLGPLPEAWRMVGAFEVVDALSSSSHFLSPRLNLVCDRCTHSPSTPFICLFAPSLLLMLLLPLRSSACPRIFSRCPAAFTSIDIFLFGFLLLHLLQVRSKLFLFRICDCSLLSRFRKDMQASILNVPT